MKRNHTYRGTIALLLLQLVACRGPDPVVESQRLETRSDRFVVEAQVRNRSRGDGEVEVAATISDKRSGVVVASADRSLPLSAHQTALVRLEMPRPAAVAESSVANLALEVTAQYPVR